MNEAITRNRLDHRADAAALEGTWSQLLGGMNETMAAFADLQGRRREAELELERVFTMSVDLLCIAGFDGYLKRVNPPGCAPSATRSRSCCRDRSSSSSTPRTGRTPRRRWACWPGRDLVEFENRHLCRDGSARWMQWTSRPALEQGVAYTVGRDVTDRKRREVEEAALRRVATLVARAAAPGKVFDAVAREVGLQCDADIARLERFERDGTVTVVAAWSRSGADRPAVGIRFALTGRASPPWWRRPAGRRGWTASRVRPRPIARENQALGIRSSVGCPIVVGGRTWG